MLSKFEISRALRIIERSIDTLKLDLSDLTVLTEVGSNYFLLTPIIASMGGAKKVFAWTRDSSYGRGVENVERCRAIISEYNINDCLEYAINQRPELHIQEADIITNLGFVRPLDSNFLSKTKKGAVISGMCEAWELRNRDLDIKYCLDNKILLAGTWENHPDLKIFDGCGALAIKMAFEAGFEVYRNKIVIWSDDHFGEVIARAFVQMGASDVKLTTDMEFIYSSKCEADFIFFCDYDEQRELFGKQGLIDIERLKMNPLLPGIVHLYGNIDAVFLQENGFTVFPPSNGRASVMTRTLAHLGPMLVLDLHSAGLKVGESLVRNQLNDLVQIIK